MLLVHLFVCFVRVSVFPFSLPLGVGGWLRFVTVALPGLFYKFLYKYRVYKTLYIQTSIKVQKKIIA